MPVRGRHISARITVLLLAGVLMLGACVQDIKQDRTRTVLIRVGVPPSVADCMAHHMARELTVTQLRHLQVLNGPKQSWADYVDAVNRVNDPDALKVLIRSYAACQPGQAG